MTRLLLAACLSFLLLGLQEERLVHALQHDAARVADARDTAFHNAAGEGPCVYCALFAGGSHAIIADRLAFVPDALVHARPSLHEHRRHAAAPVYYSSRAPPLAR